MARHEIRILRRLIRLGNSLAVTIPPAFAPKSEYVWLIKQDGEIILREAQVT